jgi:GNAT superfamily N-acetyltransferase
LSVTIRVKEPTACTVEERLEFARLVREGFHGSDESLVERIECAHWLAFGYEPRSTLVAIAGIKAPDERYRRELFSQACVEVSPAECEHELGWVYVDPAHRGMQIAVRLSRRLLGCVSGSNVFATTRTSNAPMIGALSSLGFERVGRPYLRREERLVVYLRR